MTSLSHHQHVAEELWESERSRKPISPVSQRTALTIEDAYAIQKEYVFLKRGDGVRVRGWKVGLTSVAMQQLLGVDQPDWGVLLASMDLTGHTTCAMSRMIQPKVEPEIAFRLARDLKGPGVTLVDALAALDRAWPALEIIDSRIIDWKIGIVDTIADNASSAFFLREGDGVPVADLDLASVGVTFEKNGEIVATGSGSAVLGHPVAPVAWLANTLADYNDGLCAGQIVLPGALVAAVSATTGDRFRAVFHGLGQVAITFTS